MECATFGEIVASHCKVHTGIQYFLGTGRSRSLRQWRHWRRLRLAVGSHQCVTQALQRTERWRTDGRCDGRNGLGAERRCGRRGRCGRLVTVGRWAHKQLTTAITHFAHVHKNTHTKHKHAHSYTAAYTEAIKTNTLALIDALFDTSSPESVDFAIARTIMGHEKCGPRIIY